MCHIGNPFAVALLLAAPVLLVGPIRGVGRLTPELTCKGII
jgi:hypothetical protein